MNVSSQPCLPEGIMFTTQAQIDNFQTNYPDCSVIEGWVTIFDGHSGDNITNLTGLNVLTSIGGDFIIEANDSLNNLTGLGGLTSIGGSFEILHNYSLSSLTALENLSSIGGDLWIRWNATLTSLIGLNNIAAGSINKLKIYDNSSLSICEVESICYYLVIPSGEVQISNNATGCDSQEEVEEACDEIFCLPEGIQFYSQESINNFQINYPGCTEIEGYVRIKGNDITNLNGLNVITSIGGSLEIYGNPLLTNLVGLDALNHVEGTIHIGEWMPAGGNPALENLEGLNNLVTINNLRIVNNDYLSSLTGLDNLNSISGNLYIYNNWNLTSLTGLENLDTIGGDLTIIGTPLINLMGLDNLTSIGGYIVICGTALINLTGMSSLNHIGGGMIIGAIDLIGGGNGLLTDLSGLENISSIGGDVDIGYNPSLTSLTGLKNVTSINGYLDIHYNDALNKLSGLDNIASGSITNLTITNNSSLSTCDVQSICDYLASPNGSIEIHDNLVGCNSQAEVEESCGIIGVDEIISDIGFMIYPNPSNDQVIFNFTLSESSKVKLEVMNSIGQVVVVLLDKQLSQGGQQVVWNAENMPTGLYFYRLTANGDPCSLRDKQRSLISQGQATGKWMVVR